MVLVQPLVIPISIILLAGIREHIEGNDIPYNFQGSPIVLVTAGLMAIAFLGFSGLTVEGGDEDGYEVQCIISGSRHRGQSASSSV